MDLRQLEYFVAVADHKSITKGAAALYVSQPTVSQQITALERELGKPLFERHTNGVTLTDAGQTLLTYALRILQNVADAREEILGSQGRDATVRIGVLPTLTRSILPSLIKHYQTSRPDFHIDVTEASTQTLVKQVISGDLQMALLDLPLSDPLLHVEKLWSEELILIASPDFHLPDQSLQLTELKNQPFITMEAGYGLRDALFRLTQPFGYNPNITLELTSLGAIIGFVRQGFGISLVARRTVQLEIATGEIRALTLHTPIYRDIGVIWRNQRQLSAAALAFAKYLRNQFQNNENEW
ncbi:LysR family transcriptional regulator [Sulfoacidibacillus thermotolerans]|uniref:HTH lysR-type domain-containing protein n=1 Tax=Sulfoacidibacillus thermotolerans TaxID=1765684 RepID=A0A2U3DCA5_SULT2|nr:LysR family transcriptional regulator [Sulfoacidibacillus thermotolerans]PWI58875.1 hypothetical protein BM613_01965 [Sulfoacidibacillus thermotolerans]